MSRDDEERRAFALGPGHDPRQGDDEDDRQLLIEEEHPDLRRAIDEGRPEIRCDGIVISPVLHIAMHVIVANQVMDDDPPETWDTAKRLLAAGYERHELQHMLASVVSEDVYAAMKGESPDPEQTRSRLAALPASWEQARADIPLLRHDTRAQRRAARLRPRRPS